MKSYKLFNRTGAQEIDVRKELNNSLFGASDEIAKGAIFILRRMRRGLNVLYPSSTSDLQQCGCSSGPTKEPNIEHPCDRCDGEGFLFDEEVVTGYKTNRFEYQDVERHQPWGKETHGISFFYIEYHEEITRYDKIIEPVIDLSGNIASPLKKHQQHSVHMAERFRADKGRTEYWRVACWTE